MSQIKEIAAYVRNNVEDYEERLQLAFKRMDRMREPLQMADEELYDDITNAIEEWCDDNEVSVEFDEDWTDFIEGDEGIIWEE
jgi:hypothetical protein